MYTKRMVLWAAAAVFGFAAPVGATELLVNGGFETGNFSGWTVTDQAGGSGTFSISTPGAVTPISGFPTAVNSFGGSFYAVSDQTGPGAHTLMQSFTVLPGSTVALSFQMFVNDWSGMGPLVNPAGLDLTANPNQHARVDILAGGAGAFDTGAGVLGNLYLGIDTGANPNAYTNYSFDITPFVGAGGIFQIRFAEVDNQGFFNVGVDNVSVNANAAHAVPEPSGLGLLGLGLLGILGINQARRRQVGEPAP